ncbi:MAG: D-alanine--D-alanine ligase [Clostridiales bacterium]|jgi:D-alanine-D-alanine ligase|nr:D-alanine--D-alanine ligase [Clostridiales bacterium]
MDKKVVAVLFGGKSSEHEVSKMSAATIMAAMDEDKYFVLPIYITKEGRWYLYDGPRENISNISDTFWDRFATPAILSPDTSHGGLMRLIGDKFKLMPVDVVFPVLHGKNGEDGTIQGLFELAGIAYVGNGVLASAVAMDKAFTNMVAEKIGIKIPDYRYFYKRELDEDIDAVAKTIRYKIGYPCFVKPANTGSSVGISMASNKKQLIAALLEAAKYDNKIVVEKRAAGRELECSVLGNDDPLTSGAGEITYEREFYCYEAKYKCTGSQTHTAPELPDEIVAQVKEISLKIYKALGCRGLARVDFFLTNDGEVLFNEINTLPGFTNISMYPLLLKEAGIEIEELVDKLIELALEGSQ